MSASLRTQRSTRSASRFVPSAGVIAGLFVSQLALGACGASDLTSPSGGDSQTAPRTVTFDEAAPTGGGHKNASKTRLSGYYWGWDSQGGGRLFAESVLGLGINEKAQVTAYVKNDIPAEPGHYRVTADVSWRGYLYGVGAAGTGAKASFVMRVTDASGRELVSPVTIAEKEVREFALTTGGVRHEGTATPLVEFTLPAGDTGFTVQFELTCETYGGFLSAEAGCLYGTGKVARLIGLGGFARWTRLSITENP